MNLESMHPGKIVATATFKSPNGRFLVHVPVKWIGDGQEEARCLERAAKLYDRWDGLKSQEERA